MKIKLNQHRMQENAGKAANLLKSLASVDRLMILCQLLEGERCVGDLWKNSELSQSAFSQHLAKLRQEGLVQTRKEAQVVYYRLANDNASKIIEVLHEIYCR